MLGNTHFVIGTTAALAVMKPEALPQLLTGIFAAAVGSLISDIDVETSKASREVGRFIAVFIAALFIIPAIEYIYPIGIMDLILKNSSLLRIITGLAGFVCVCAFGKKQPHRSFMHSFLALALLSVMVAVINPAAMPYFAIAFTSHLVADLLNYKKVQLLYPLHDGFSLKVCHAKGVVNSALFMAGSALLVVEVLMRVWVIYR